MRPPAISVTMDRAKMRAFERAVADTPRALPRIMVRSLKGTAKGARTQLDEEIRAGLRLSKKAVMKRIVDEEKATSIKWAWRLGISRRRISLSSFSYSELKRGGISYAVRRGQRRRIPEAFVREMPAKDDETYKVIFRRAGDEGHLVPRYPLIVPRGPSLGQILEDVPGKLRRVADTGAKRLEREIVSQVDRHLARRLPK